MSIHIDDHELTALINDLRAAPARLRRNERKTMGDAAALVGREMRVDAAGHRYLKHLPTSVSQTVFGPTEAEVGLGPKRGTQGALAHIIVYGSVNNAPVYDHAKALYRSQKRIGDMFADTAAESVLGDGSE